MLRFKPTRQRSTPSDQPPGPAGMPVLGSLLDYRKDPLKFVTRNALQFGPVVAARLLNYNTVMLNEPELIREVLQKRRELFDKGTRGYDVMRQIFGSGLLTSEGSFWLRQRRIAQPAFHRKRIDAFVRTMRDETLDCIGRLKEHGAGGSLDVADSMMELALRIVSGTLFGEKLGEEILEISEAMELLNREMRARQLGINPVPPNIPTPQNVAFQKANETIETIIYRFIKRRRAEGGEGDDLISMLLRVEDEETGERMSDEELRDEAFTLFLAGHETTGNALAWALYLLSVHPDARRRVREEARRVISDPANLDGEIARSLEYTTMVVQESLRLYPPAWITARRCTEDVEIGGYTLAEGTVVTVSPWVMHRHPEYWDNPMGFDPERFRPEEARKINRYVYFPFGGGPRICIGNTFAQMEMTVALALLCRDLDLDLDPTCEIETEALITVRPKNGVRVFVKPAAASSAG